MPKQEVGFHIRVFHKLKPKICFKGIAYFNLYNACKLDNLGLNWNHQISFNQKSKTIFF